VLSPTGSIVAPAISAALRPDFRPSFSSANTGVFSDFGLRTLDFGLFSGGSLIVRQRLYSLIFVKSVL